MMRLRYIVVFALIALLLASCAVFDAAYSKDPRKVAAKFLKYMYAGEYDKAKELGTAKTAQVMDLMEQLMAIAGTGKELAVLKGQKTEVTDCTVKGDSAQCNYVVEGKANVIDLVRVDNKWLVDMKKESKPKADKNKFLNEKTNTSEQPQK